MKFWQAMKALEEGKTVKCLDWDEIIPSKEEESVPLGVCKVSIDWMQLIDTKWELYEEPVQLLSFSDVVKGLKEGKKFGREIWSNGPYILLKHGYIHWDCEGDPVSLPIKDLEANDWVEVRE